MTSTYRLKRQKRERKIYNERQKLLSLPGAMATAVDQQLMKKYKIGARSTIWQIVQRHKHTTQPHESSDNNRGTSQYATGDAGISSAGIEAAS